MPAGGISLFAGRRKQANKESTNASSTTSTEAPTFLTRPSTAISVNGIFSTGMISYSNSFDSFDKDTSKKSRDDFSDAENNSCASKRSILPCFKGRKNPVMTNDNALAGNETRIGDMNPKTNVESVSVREEDDSLMAASDERPDGSPMEGTIYSSAGSSEDNSNDGTIKGDPPAFHDENRINFDSEEELLAQRSNNADSCSMEPGRNDAIGGSGLSSKNAVVHGLQHGFVDGDSENFGTTKLDATIPREARPVTKMDKPVEKNQSHEVFSGHQKPSGRKESVKTPACKAQRKSPSGMLVTPEAGDVSKKVIRAPSTRCGHDFSLHAPLGTGDISVNEETTAMQVQDVSGDQTRQLNDLSSPCSDEDFEALLSGFLTDLRDGMDLLEKGDTELLEMDIELSKAFATTLCQRGEIWALLDEAEHVEALANSVIGQYHTM